MASISDLLAAKLKADELSTAGAAKAAGVSLPSMRSALKGTSLPNARSVGKYATFLGLSQDEVVEIIAAAKGGKSGGRKAAKGATRGRPPGRKSKGAGGDTAAALETIKAALKAAASASADPLAEKIAELSKKQRSIVENLINDLLS
jgi:hypothetical protein